MLMLFLTAAALVATMATVYSPARDPFWYETLVKPGLMPPDWVLSSIWLLLSVLLASAAWLVWCSAPWRSVAAAMLLWWTQLVLCGLFPALLFGFKDLDGAIAVAVALVVAAGTTIGAFGRHSRTAAWLLAPFLGWVSYLASMVHQTWLLNV